jgi:hypothetical protein
VEHLGRVAAKSSINKMDAKVSRSMRNKLIHQNLAVVFSESCSDRCLRPFAYRQTRSYSVKTRLDLKPIFSPCLSKR